MFAAELMSMVEAGAGLVVGTVSADGEPRAARAWAVRVVDADAGRLRIAISADDPVLVGNLEVGAVSVTGADVRTFRSVQMKGRVAAVEPPTADDVELVHRQSAAFFEAVHATDGNPVELLRRILPTEVVVVEMVVEDVFDQTPGPGAGARMGTP